MCAHVCLCFWVVALVCMLCVVGISLWVCFGSARVSGACTCVGLYSVCGEAPVRHFSGTGCGLAVSQRFHTESFPRLLFPYIFLLRPHCPLWLSLQGSVSQRQELRLRVACPFPTQLLSSPHWNGVAVAVAVSGCSEGFLCDHRVFLCIGGCMAGCPCHMCVSQSLWTAYAAWSCLMCFCV